MIGPRMPFDALIYKTLPKSPTAIVALLSSHQSTTLNYIMDNNMIINTIANCDTEDTINILKSACNKELFDAAKNLKIIETIPWEDVNDIKVEFNLESSKKSKRTLKNIKKHFGIDHVYERKRDSDGDYVVEGADKINDQVAKLKEFTSFEQEPISAMVVTEYTNIVIYTNKKDDFINGIMWLKSDDMIDRLKSDLFRKIYLSLDFHINNSNKWAEIFKKSQDAINNKTKILNINVGSYEIGPLNKIRYIPNLHNDKFSRDIPDRYISNRFNCVEIYFQSSKAIANFNININ